MPFLAKGHRPDINNGPGVTRIVPTFWPQHLFKLNSNNSPSPGHSNLGSDGRYTCSGLLLMVPCWVPHLPKGCRPDFNNGLEGDLNSGPVLAPRRLFDSDSNNGLPATLILCQMKSIYLFKSPIYAGINLTGYHPPRADRQATNFFRQNPHPRDSFSVQNSSHRVKNETKIPTPGYNLPSSNAKISMKREHYSIKAVSFQIFHNCPFDNFYLS